MAELDALQHIYINVEADQSPSGRGGFQTLFASPGLTRDDISEIEERVLYFADENSPPKRVFHALSCGRVMLAHITPIAAKDRHGRGGRYLAHTVVFERDAFEAAAGTPFGVFRAFAFVDAVEAALAAGDPATGHIPAIRVSVPEERRPVDCGGWSPEALTGLATLAARAPSFAEEHVSVAFAGAPHEVEAALETAFQALPHSRAPLCSFDTHFHGGNLAATYFWGIGVAQASRNPRVHNVDAANRTVASAGEVPPAASYERWLARTIAEGRFPQPEPTRAAALSLCEWLDGSTEECAEPPQDLLRAVFEAASGAVSAKLAAQVAAHLPPLLAPRAHGRLLLELTPDAAYVLLRAGADLPTVSDALWRAYDKAGFEKPEKDERKELGTLLETLEHRDLKALHACWSGNERGLRALLEAASDADYEQWVGRCARHALIEVQALILDGREALFAPALAAALRRGLGEAHLPAVVDALLSSPGGAAALDALIPLLGLADAGALKAIAKRVRKDAAASDRFRDACETAVERAPKKPGLIGRILGRSGEDEED